MKKIYALVLGLVLSSSALAQYCVTGVGPSFTGDTNVEGVALNGETMNINYTGCPGVAGVEDQTSQVADVIAGNSYTVDVTWGTCGGSYSNACEVWIDFDGSQSFEPSESVGTLTWAGGTGNLQSYGFTVPVLALNGTHRMRVMSRESGALPLDPCGAYDWGSVTDFSITITGGSSCGPATALSVSNVQSTSADLSWTQDGGSVTDNVEWGFPGFTPGTGAEQGSATGVSGGTTSATGLLSATNYEYYVQTDCGGTQSAWAGPYSFSTSGTCGFFDISLFDTWGDGWNGGTVDVYINGVLYQSGLTVASGNGPVVYQIPVNNGDIVSLDYTAGGFSSENEITVYDQIGTVVATEGLSGATPNDIGDYTIPTGLVACPSCPSPSNFASSNLTDTSVDLSWTENGGATAWEIEYGAPGFTPGTGTSMITANNPETVSGLTSETPYDFYLRAVCGAGDTSIYVGPLSIVTPLASLNCSLGDPYIMYEADFEGGFPGDWSSPVTGPDWTQTTGGTTSTGTGPTQAHSGTGYMYLETSSGTTGQTDTLFAPDVDLTTGSGEARVTFYYHMFGATMSKLAVEASGDGITWTEIWSDSGQVQALQTDPWLATQADLTPYVGNVVSLRVIGHRGSSFTGDMAIDFWRVEACLTCPQPTALDTSNVTETTVDLNWTAGNTETAWVIEYGPDGFTPGTGTTVGTTSNPHTVTGLIDNTDYDFYVYADCGGGDTSMYTGPVSAWTDTVCAPVTNLAFTYTGNDTVAFDWTPGFLESMWNVSYGTAGFTPGSGTQFSTSNFPDSVTGLGAGVWDFYVQADCGSGLNNPWTGPITYTVPLTNDIPCTAIDVPVDGSSTTYHNLTATEGGSEPTNGFNTVWFTFDAPTTGHVEIRTCGNDFDNMIAVYEATDCNNFGTFTLVDEATFNPFAVCSGVDPAGMNLCGLTPGNTYYLVVGSETSGNTGIFPLQLTELPAVEAGTAMPVDACEDDTAVELFNAITGNLTQNGQWYENAATAGNEINNSVSMLNYPVGTNTFFYVDQEVCGTDTVETTVNVVALPNVGVGSTINAGCNYGAVSLFDGLSGNVDLGGTWYDSDGTPVGGSLVNFDGEAAGTYTYNYVVDNGVCPADSSTVQVDIIDCTGIGEEDITASVYPNPVSGILFVNLPNADAGTTVQLIGINGQAVAQPMAVNSDIVKIDMSDYADGVYFIRVTANGATKEIKVVKQ
ncbi:fibronectin type III domain-containing protein [Paracrocinitomix mangrovi]|uniref:fibronectin type III domain-containing protein n=1 Tax=Paracrocinitomix mangrovi TaxID=2862509 RepID=UPI001C8DC851|nr:fibronectin type III domain-containing protein [Paracrocinitomix mangrovi]UKN00898.1 fibronectin type III domain-containing protein [Paracrocinitomix mangrovi]